MEVVDLDDYFVIKTCLSWFLPARPAYQTLSLFTWLHLSWPIYFPRLLSSAPPPR